MPQKKCDWNGCSEIGFFDGRDKTLLTEQGKKHIYAFLKLTFLCPYHFQIGVGLVSEVGEESVRGTHRLTPDPVAGKTTPYRRLS
jgi:hypothetical protein